MAFKYSAKAFIKVYRKFMNWEWYTDTNTKALFLHCLLRANWEEGQWQGIHYDAGEFITSLPSLASETGLSIQQVRSALAHLTATGEITSKSTAKTTVKTTDKSTGKVTVKTTDRILTKCRIITVNNWDKYQPDNSQLNSQTNRQLNRQINRISNRQPTGNQQQIKNNKEYIKEYKKEARPAQPLPSEEKVGWDIPDEEFKEA